MYICFEAICGCMLGLEYLMDDNVLVIDLLIVRIYIGKFEDSNE